MMEEIKIVTYNVNGLRPRIAQFGSLLKFLSSLDAHIICLQETKLSRQEFTADLVMADGYESFFSCTKTTGQGRVGYSGVATFCRVKCPFSSNEVALPLAAEEGFTGLLETSRDFGNKYSEKHGTVEGLDGFEKEELLKVDSEGRCVITDHGHFVLFNIYGPCVPSDDAERTQFKLTFFEILQKRWEILLKQGRTVVVVGDLNIAPAAIDRCDAKPDFEKNEFRTWMRSMLVEHGGPFYDIFRAKHPERRDAYTCWSQSTGAEEFNYGSRIDHILISKACLHKKHDTEENHNFVTCHVKDCDIMMQFQRWKPGITPRWKGGRSNKLEGSDHVPVYTTLMELPQVQEHSTPSLSTRYTPMVRGIQQTLASVLLKRQENGKAIFNEASIDVSNENSMKPSCSEKVKRTIQSSSNTETKDIMNEAETKKKPRQNQWSQLSLKSFFQKTSDVNICDETQIELNVTNSTHDQENQNESGSQKEKNNHALLEWQRIQDRMRNSIPLCKGHGEKCVARVVKKPGPNCGRRFYVCCRPEGPASNPETNCGYFKWVAPKSRSVRQGISLRRTLRKLNRQRFPVINVFGKLLELFPVVPSDLSSWNEDVMFASSTDDGQLQME